MVGKSLAISLRGIFSRHIPQNLTDIKKGDMMKTKMTHRLFSLGLALVMAFSLAAMASAAMITSATKSYTLGSYVAYTTTGYLYYSDNTTSSITVDKMGFSAKNNGQTDLQYGFFRGYDGKGLGVGHSILNPYEGDQFWPEMEYAIAPGQLSQYFTPPWGL